MFLGFLERFKVGFSGFPGVGNFDDYASDEAQQGVFVGKKSDNSCAAFDLAVERFAGVGCAHFAGYEIGSIARFWR